MLSPVLSTSFATLMDYSLPDSSVHGIFQVRILEWVAISYSRGSFLTQGRNPPLLCLLHWQEDSLPIALPGSPGSQHKESGVPGWGAGDLRWPQPTE